MLAFDVVSLIFDMTVALRSSVELGVRVLGNENKRLLGKIQRENWQTCFNTI